jgi:hypothetical protein
VHELEAIAGYQPALRESLRRKPTPTTVWMINRILNGRLQAAEHESWISELQKALKHPLASEAVRSHAQEYLEYQESQS